MQSEAFWARLHAVVDQPDRAQAFFDLCALYRRASSTQRTLIRSWWTVGRWWRVPNPGTILSQDPAGHSSFERLRAERMYQSIENARADWRDNVIELDAASFSAFQLGPDARRLFAKAASCSVHDPLDHRMADMLWVEAHSPARAPSLNRSGWRAVETPDGTKLEGWRGTHVYRVLDNPEAL
jgi:hypothetical protein